MHWKTTYTETFLVLIASAAAALLAGWGSLIRILVTLHLGFLFSNWLLFIIEIVTLGYTFKLLLIKKDEFTPFIAGIGSFFILVGGFVGPMVVLIGMVILLFTIGYHQRVTLQAPELPDIKKMRKRI